MFFEAKHDCDQGVEIIANSLYVISEIFDRAKLVIGQVFNNYPVLEEVLRSDVLSSHHRSRVAFCSCSFRLLGNGYRRYKQWLKSDLWTQIIQILGVFPDFSRPENVSL
jgi:hypothetical protein